MNNTFEWKNYFFFFFLNSFVGLVLIFNGSCHSLFSYVLGGLVKCIGRLGCFIIAALLNFGCLLLMYFWEPLGDQLYILFLLSGLWGVAGAVWQAQVVGKNFVMIYSETIHTIQNII